MSWFTSFASAASKYVVEFLAYLPVVLGLVQEAEKAFSGQPGSGPKKKAFALDLAGVAMKAVNDTGKANITDEQQKSISGTLGTIIDGVVAANNTAGLFTKSK